MRVGTKHVEMRLAGGEADRLVEILQRSGRALMHEMEFSPVLEGLPETGTQPDGLGEPRQGAIRAAGGGELVGLIQHRRGVRDCAERPAILHLEIYPGDNAEAGDPGGSL